MALTGVAVTTSSPKTVTRASSATASMFPNVKMSGRETAQPTRPPASRSASSSPAPPLPGAPQPMWTSPSTPTSRAESPITIRPLASGFSGWRISRTAMTASSIGTSRSSLPNAPVTSISTRSPTGPWRLDQVPAATISARPISSSASPSLRWAGSSAFPLRPMPRRSAPRVCARPSQHALSTLSTPLVGDGAAVPLPPLAAGFLAGAFLAAAFLGGAFFAGAAFADFGAAFLAGAFLAAFPVPDAREAMGARLPGSGTRGTEPGAADAPPGGVEPSGPGVTSPPPALAGGGDGGDAAHDGAAPQGFLTGRLRASRSVSSARTPAPRGRLPLRDPARQVRCAVRRVCAPDAPRSRRSPRRPRRPAAW